MKIILHNANNVFSTVQEMKTLIKRSELSYIIFELFSGETLRAEDDKQSNLSIFLTAPPRFAW